MRWYHWVGGVSVALGANAAILAGMGQGYRWFFSDDEKAMRSFREKYGRPTEQQRLELFAAMASQWDHSVGKVEETGADRYRTELFAKASGDVLEVAVGTGRCFKAIPQSGEVTSYTGVDIIQAMLDQAQTKLTELPYPSKLVHSSASRLPFPDNSFDTIMGSLCLCSLEHPGDALREMARVCKEDGQVLLVEPGVAENWAIRSGQDFMGFVPNHKLAWEVGWYDDRDPVALLKTAGLRLKSFRTRAMGNWYLLEAAPRPKGSVMPTQTE